MKRILALVLLALGFPVVVSSEGMPIKYRVALSEGGAGLVRGLIFHAPLDDPSSPLRLYKGTGPLSLVRVHDATHTATYIHPVTGLVTVADNNQLRIEAQGTLIEGERTNLLLRSRGLDNGVWVKTNISVSATRIGHDGVDNAAYAVWATDNNGAVCQSITSASAAHSGAFDLLRITGTGTVKISLDNGATWGSDVSGSLSTSTWYRASKENQTLANPTLCLYLGTVGDNVAIDYAQLEVGAFVSSRIPTTTAAATRNADVPTFASSGNVSGTAGTMAFTIDSVRALNAGTFYLIDSAAGGNPIAYKSGDSGGAFALWDGAADRTERVYNDSSVHKFAVSWGGTTTRLTRDGLTAVERGFDGDQGVGATIKLGGSFATGDFYMYGHINNLRFWNRALTDAELQSIAR